MSLTNVVRKIYVDGTVEDVQEKMTLDELQEFVGGYIEFVPTTIPHRALVINEEGLLNNLPDNWLATELVPPTTLCIGAIRGNALLVKC